MSKTCIGCGAILQDKEINEVGYVSSLEKDLCERCFQIRHYNKYQVVEKTNQEYEEILKNIAKTKDLVIFVVDVLHINQKIKEVLDFFNQDILLVLTKRDLLPKVIYEQRLLDYMDVFSNHFVDKIMISSQKNYQFDELYEKIKKYQKSPRVYVVGLTNAGKSTMLNQFLKDYTKSDKVITTSMLPSTTLNMIEIPIDESLTLIDTPGILDEGNFIHIIEDGKLLKKITPKKEIRPISYQVKGTQYFKIEDFFYLEAKDNQIIFYVSNALSIERYYQKKEMEHLVCHHISVKGKEDLVIPGLGFIKFMKPGTIVIYLPEGVNCYTRKSFI
ncbi:MAG: 50S ribosome-binding GTPase [Firmicutes bacterium]|nr:50S ribosome-binding GTPase [Bacillota bacterium]